MPGFTFASGRANYAITASSSQSLPTLIAASSIADVAGLTYAITNTSGSAITLSATSISNSGSWTFATSTSFTMSAGSTVVVETVTAGNTYAIIASSMSSGGGGSITAAVDSTSASPVYPTFVHSPTGSITTLYNNDNALQYTPSTGAFASTSFDALGGIFYNPKIVTSSATVPSGYNGFSVAPITIPPGIVANVQPGAIWKLFG